MLLCDLENQNISKYLNEIKEFVLDENTNFNQIKKRIALMELEFEDSKDRNVLEEYFKVKTEIYLELKSQVKKKPNTLKNLHLDIYLSTW